MKKILCFLNIHQWKYTSNTERECKHCKRSEYLDVDSDVNAFGNPLWLKKSKKNWFYTCHWIVPHSKIHLALIIFDDFFLQNVIW